MSNDKFKHGVNMKNQFRIRLGLYLFLGLCTCAQAQTKSAMQKTGEKETAGAIHATGDFDVKLTPHRQDGAPGDSSLGSMLIAKQYHGDLDAIGKGQMLTAMTPIKGSAVYVAIERVTGTLHGRRGSFVLQHNGTMTRGAQQLSITVVPDSGTEQLVGLAGKLTIKITEGKHFYNFEYTLTPEP
jgi:hypothetical protein